MFPKEMVVCYKGQRQLKVLLGYCNDSKAFPDLQGVSSKVFEIFLCITVFC